jgi:HSP20 family protein
MSEQPSIQQVPVKVYRATELLTVAAPMPGLGPEDIQVEITSDGRLTLAGDLRGALKDVKEILSDEWHAGPYYRELRLPAPVDGERATVTYGNGVVVVAMPLSDRTRSAKLRLDENGPVRGERVPPA